MFGPSAESPILMRRPPTPSFVFTSERFSVAAETVAPRTKERASPKIRQRGEKMAESGRLFAADAHGRRVVCTDSC